MSKNPPSPVSPATVAPRTKDSDQMPKTWGVLVSAVYAGLRDQAITITATDGKVYTMTLVGVDQYDLILRQKDGTLTVMPKHVIKFITPVNRTRAIQ